MKITGFILLVTFAFVDMVGNANASTVMGDISCQQWMDRKNNPAEGERYAIWMEGYLSGANAMFGEMVDRDFIKNSERISVANWTDAYCQKNPKSMLHESSNALIKLLKRETAF